MLKQFFLDESGQTLVEYGLLILLIALVLVKVWIKCRHAVAL